MEKVQIIRDAKGEPIAAVMPWAEYERLTSEDAVLIAAGNAARGEETFPAAIARRLVAGDVPLKVFREWRGLAQGNLGAAANVAPMYISQIERGARNLGRKTAMKLAPILGVSVDALLDNGSEVPARSR